jgi:uncharacterized OB-fold protein
LFGEESSQVAIRLLRNALRAGHDLEVKEEIENRLKSLEPKQASTSKCTVCGRVFEPRRFGRFVDRVCEKCRTKKRSSR